MKDRRSFLKEVCPTVAFAFFGVSFLEACSSGDDDVATTDPNNGGETGTGGGSGNGNTNGYSTNGNTYTIDLTHSNFSTLNTVGNWINGKSIGIPALFLRISTSEIQAYTNVCPHQGHDEWTYNNNSFKCSRPGASHGKEFSDDCNSQLSCYASVIEGNSLTVTMS
jgi:hypothetical protein